MAVTPGGTEPPDDRLIPPAEPASPDVSTKTIDDQTPVEVPPPTDKSTKTIGDKTPVEGGKLTVEERREATRGVLAAFLIAVVGSFAILGVALLARGTLTSTELRTVAELLFTPLVGIAGTVLGFYFGAAHSAATTTAVATTPPASTDEKKPTVISKFLGR